MWKMLAHSLGAKAPKLTSLSKVLKGGSLARFTFSVQGADLHSKEYGQCSPRPFQAVLSCAACESCFGMCCVNYQYCVGVYVILSL